MRYCNFLELNLPGFYPTEGETTLAWKWQEGSISSIGIPAHPHGYEFRFQARVPLSPEATNNCMLFINEEEVGSDLFSKTDTKIAGKISLPPNLPCTITFKNTFSNSSHSFAPNDARDLGLCFTQLEIIAQNFLQAPLCPMPFTRMEIHGDSHFVPCCSPWLTEEYHSMAEEAQDPWNSDQAQKLRASILDGNYRYCRRDLCHTLYTNFDELEDFSQEQNEFHLSLETVAAIKKGEEIIPNPSALTFLADARCNLACGSCRSEMIHTLSPEAEMRRSEGEKQLKKHSTGLHRLRLAGDGEALFSPYLRSVIQGLNPIDFPFLQIVELHTNGLLLTEKNLNSLLPGSNYLNRILLSIDAGDPQTYAKVRGGDWQKLMENLRWVAQEKAKGRFESLVLMFVYRAENFLSMKSMASIAKEHKADGAYFSPLLPWDRMAIANYEKEAVHLPTHPVHQSFLKEIHALEEEYGEWVHIT